MLKGKSPKELSVMRKSGSIAGKVLTGALEMVVVGCNPVDIEKFVVAEIERMGGKPSFKSVPGYNYATCINVNDGVVHGIPTGAPFKNGDIVKVDLGVEYRGFHTDLAWTVVVGGKTTNEIAEFLATGEQALYAAMDKCQIGNSVSDISSQIQRIVEGNGYNVSRDLVGHGVGHKLHEDPQIPGFDDGKGAAKLIEGLTIAIEVIYMMGDWRVVEDSQDLWTIRTKDGSIAALFEHTVAITKKGPKVLTNHAKSR